MYFQHDVELDVKKPGSQQPCQELRQQNRSVSKVLQLQAGRCASALGVLSECFCILKQSVEWQMWQVLRGADPEQAVSLQPEIAFQPKHAYYRWLPFRGEPCGHDFWAVGLLVCTDCELHDVGVPERTACPHASL